MRRPGLYLLVFALGCAGGPEPAADQPRDEAASREAETPDSIGPTGDRAPGADPACASVAEEGPGTRAIDGAHRACTADADCRSVRIDCSNIRCTAVHGDHAPAYEAPLSCDGWTGIVANYDCMPRFGSEQPACVNGCCVSERQSERASGQEACDAIAQVYARDGCTVFGPSFGVDQCLADVADIEEGGDRRQLQIGLDCARSISSCAQLRFCVQQFRGG